MAVLTLAEIRAYLRYDSADTSNDTAHNIILDGGQRWIENYTGHLLTEREVVETPVTFPIARRLNEVPYFDLRWKPYKADSLEIGYLDSALEAASFEDVTLYAFDGTTRVIPTLAWPGNYLGVTFTYTAGYANAAAVPDDLFHALAIYAAMTDDERASPDAGAWRTLDNILGHYRLPVLA